MKEKIRNITKYIKAHVWLGLLVACALGMNNNYHTESWINRIVPPIEYEGMTWFTGTIILIIIIYNLFRAFYYTTGNYLFNKSWKCFIGTVIIVNLISGINTGTIQKIRGLKSGIQAVYLCREEPNSMMVYDLSKEGQEAYKMECSLTLKNCSNRSTGPFTVEIILPESEDKKVSGSFISDKTYELNPKEQETISIDLTGKLNNVQYLEDEKMYIMEKQFRVVLKQDHKQVTFYEE